ncbi:hypothetical protein FB446DRAFT_652661, partial [Lentinula raphanica]
IFDQHVHISTDISHTKIVQDMWTVFAQTGDPNPDLEDLVVCGPAYRSTI